MELRDLLVLIKTRWIGLIAATLLGAMGALALSLATPPTYQARVQFYVSVSGGDSATAAYQGSLGAQQRVQSYVNLVSSSDVAREVAAAAGPAVTPDDVRQSTAATADPKTVLLNIAVRGIEPEKTLAIAEAYGEVFPVAISRLETPEAGAPPLVKVSVVDSPQLPTEPVSPKTERNMAIGALIGLVVGVALTVLGSALDRRIKSAEQIEAITKAPIVGALPHRRREDKQENAEHLVPFREGHSPAAEAFRRLRTNLKFLGVDKPARVFVVTSSVAAEGKSETALNLSLSLAEAGNRVLVVEADLRRPRVSAYLNMSEKIGLTNVLSGEVKFEDVVQETRQEEVDMLASGPVPPNPSELIASETARSLFEKLRDRYDYVIIDSPPLLPVTDASLLAEATDGAILVVRKDKTTIDQVVRSVDNLKKADARLLGVVTVEDKAVRKNSTEYYEAYY